MQTIDTLIHAGWIITCNTQSQILENHSIGIHNGKIHTIAPTQHLNLQGKTTLNLRHHVIMPGLINAHTHAAMSLFRGLADDKPLMDWLNNYIWPAEQSYVDELFVQDGTMIAMAEMIRSGTTCFSDMYFFPEITAKAVNDVGMRAQLSFPIFNMPSNWGVDADDYLQKGMQLFEQYQQHPLISIALGPHAPYTVDNITLEKVAELAAKNKANIQMHVHETADEVEQAEETNGERPISRLAHLKLLHPRFQAVHMTHLSKDDIQTIARSGAHIIHCPESNMKLAAGFCPVNECVKAGINVALGTDGAASNNDLDMFSEMRTAALIAKATSQDSTVICADTAIKMATINGAKALGIDKITGSLEIGKQADVILIPLNKPHLIPLYNIYSQIVYSMAGSDVDTVIVNGKIIMRNGKILTINEQEVIEKVKVFSEKIKEYITLNS